jgi:hypothetical protein
MADLYLKRLDTERKALWATCRLKGLAKDTPDRQRIAELDRLIGEHANRSSLPRSDGEVAGRRPDGGASSPQARRQK